MDCTKLFNEWIAPNLILLSLGVATTLRNNKRKIDTGLMRAALKLIKTEDVLNKTWIKKIHST